MITREELKELELEVPRYEFVEAEEGNEETLPPVKRQVAKIQEAALMFTPYQVLQEIAGLKKKMQDNLDANKATQLKVDLYEAELALVEKSLHVSDLEKQYQEEVAREMQAKADEEKKTNG